jgi:hypothetical protein
MVSDLAFTESPIVQNRLFWFFSRKRGDFAGYSGNKRAAKALQQSANGTPAQKLKALAKGYTMKASLLFVMAASMILGTASVAQNTPSTVSHEPATAPRQVTPPVQNFNLSGLWRFSGADGRPYILRFEEQGNQIKEFSGGLNPSTTDVMLFQGRYIGSTVIGKGLGHSSNHRAQWVDETLTVEDPDHVHFGKGPLIARISPARADDAICDLQNSSRTQAGYAYDRALDSAKRNFPYTLNACWLQVSANQGNARAQAVTAMIFRDGEGVSKNYVTAFSWAEQSATKGDAVGEAVLGDLYKRGLGTKPNPQLAQSWQSKADAQIAALRAQQQREDEANAKIQQMIQAAIGVAIIDGLFGAGGTATSAESDIDKLNDERRERQNYWESSCTMGGGSMTACSMQSVYH